MLKARALAYFPDPFGLGRTKYAVSDLNGEAIHQIDECSLGALEDPIVTYDAPTLVDELRKSKCAPPSKLIDIGEALKLAKGTSRDEGGRKKANPWRAISNSFGPQSEFHVFKDAVQSRTEVPPAESIDLIFAKACSAIHFAWLAVQQELAQKKEIERFLSVEVPVIQIFVNRQAKGLAVSVEHMSSFIGHAKQEKYEAYRKIADMLSISPSGLHFRNVGQYLARTDAKFLGPFANSKNLEEHFKLAQDNSQFARVFLSLIRADRDLRTLMRLNIGPRVHCRFQAMGTVTGRVLVSDPLLQQLRRKYRGAITADPEMSLCYLDYRQFEPGVMAFLSGDKNFIEAYNQSDLYTSLSKALFNDELHRKQAKRVFLAFCYGMSRDNLSRLLAGDTQNADEIARYGYALENFFASFPGLEKLRRSLEASLLQYGYIASAEGNRRYRQHDGALSSSESRWCVSQAVQGTASLIFKEALIEHSKAFGPDFILLPMHDAVLMQFPKSDFEEFANTAKKIMTDAFEKRCPDIVAKISREPFDSL